MNSIRVQYIQKQVALHRRELVNRLSSSSAPSCSLNGLKLLDIGCGGGLLSESLARLGAEEVTGIDPSSHLLQVAKDRATTLFLDPSTTKPQYEAITAEELALKRPRHYDVICVMDVIEHVQNLDSLWNATSTLVKPGGLLILSTLNRTALSYALTIVGAEYVMGYVPMGTHDWNTYRSPSEVQSSLERFSFVQVDVCGMVLQRPPICGWDWCLDPGNTDINWIGAFKLQSQEPELR
ncbi:hypothetical protein ACA910_003073 [Epithemia clementina (nom. ined.)]